MSRYKLLKFFFGIASLVFFVHQFPKQQDEFEEEKAKLESDVLALQFERERLDNNTLAHFFVTCGGFI